MAFLESAIFRGSDMSSRQVWDIMLPLACVGNRGTGVEFESVNSVMINSLLCGARERILGSNVSDKFSEIFQGRISNVHVATTRVPTFSNNYQNPAFGYRSFGVLSQVPLAIIPVPPQVDKNAEILSMDFSGTFAEGDGFKHIWGPLLSAPHLNFILIFFIPLSGISPSNSLLTSSSRGSSPLSEANNSPPNRGTSPLTRSGTPFGGNVRSDPSLPPNLVQEGRQISGQESAATAFLPGYSNVVRYGQGEGYLNGGFPPDNSAPDVGFLQDYNTPSPASFILAAPLPIALPQDCDAPSPAGFALAAPSSITSPQDCDAPSPTGFALAAPSSITLPQVNDVPSPANFTPAAPSSNIGLSLHLLPSITIFEESSLTPNMSLSDVCEILGCKSVLEAAQFPGNKNHASFSSLVRNCNDATILLNKLGLMTSSEDALRPGDSITTKTYLGGLKLSGDNVLKKLNWQRQTFIKKVRGIQWAESVARKKWGGPPGVVWSVGTSSVFYFWFIFVFGID